MDDATRRGMLECDSSPVAEAMRNTPGYLRARIASLEAELRAAEQLCKIYFDIAIDIGFESGWSEENLRAERDKRIAAIDAAKEKT